MRKMVHTGMKKAAALALTVSLAATGSLESSVLKNSQYQGVTHCYAQTVAEEPFAGEGTKSSPYIIASEGNFIYFTNQMKKGEAYKGKYFKQSKSLDLSGVSEYKGIGIGTDSLEYKFSGVYNGQGYTINVGISSGDTQGTGIFPCVYGTILNLGTTGSITNTGTQSCGGICRAIGEGGQLVNCWSTTSLNVVNGQAAGLCGSLSQGIIQSCYYKGTIQSKENYGLACVKKEDTTAKVNNSMYQLKQGSSKITTKNGEGTLMAAGQQVTAFSVEELNTNRNNAANSLTGWSAEQFCEFVSVTGYDFCFAGTIAKLTKLKYKYTDVSGVEKIAEIPEFNVNMKKYTVEVDAQVDAAKPILLVGVGVDEAYTVCTTAGKSINENKNGFWYITVSGKKTGTGYETVSSGEAYIVHFKKKEVVQQTASPSATPATEPSKKPVPIVGETKEPTSNPQHTPVATATIAPSATAQVKETAVPVTTPKLTPTGIPEASPQIQTTPKPTDASESTSLPVVEGTTNPAETKRPVLLPTSQPLQTKTPIITSIPGKSVEAAQVEIGGEFVYTGSPVGASIKIVYGDRLLMEGIDYIISYENNVEMGTATIVIKGIGEYQGERREYFVITKPLSMVTVSAIQAVSYNGAAHTPAVEVRDGAYVLALGKDYKISYSQNINAGTGKVKITGIGKYTGSITKTFGIKRKSIKKLKLSKITAKKKKKGKYQIQFTLRDGTMVLKQKKHYTVSYKVQKKKIKITIKGKGNYQGTKTISVKKK